MTVRIICDFDGTIAEQDMITSIMRAFVPTESAPLIAAVQAGELSVRKGVEQMFALIPAEKYPQVVTFAQAHTVVRAGFEAFIHRCSELGWPVTVVSGGFDFFVEPVIQQLSTPVDVYCNQIEHNGSHLAVRWTVDCDAACEGGCGLCKPSVMRQLQAGGTKFVVIGDGVTDFKAAQAADYVFARASLLDLVRRRQMPASSFETFYDVIQVIDDGGSELYAHIS